MTNKQATTLLIIGVLLFSLVTAFGVWYLWWGNKIGEAVTQVSASPVAPLPTGLATPTPNGPKVGEVLETPTAIPTLKIIGTLESIAKDKGIDLAAPPTFEELLAKYPQLKDLLQNSDLGTADEAELKQVYARLLELYKNVGAAGLHEFMLSSGILESLNMDTAYFDFILAYDNGGFEAAEKMARERGLVSADNELILVVKLDTEDPAVASEVTAKFQQIIIGAKILTSRPPSMEVGIPLDNLKTLKSDEAFKMFMALSHIDHIIGIKAPNILVPNEMSFSNEGPGATGADKWQQAGFKGQNVRVGVIDPGGFRGFLDAMGKTLPPAEKITIPEDEDPNQMNSADGDGSEHGTACAEIIHAMAPEAELFLVHTNRDLRLADAVDWLISKNVQIISFSAGGFVGPMDGTGFSVDIVSKATQRGILWVNAAGNEAQSHLLMTFTDEEGDGWHEFPNGSEKLYFEQRSVEVQFTLDWDDNWNGRATQNYDLYLFKETTSGNEEVASSRNPQNGQADDMPFGRLAGGLNPEFTYFLAIRGNKISQPARLNLFGDSAAFEQSNPSSSLITPADAADALTVGAIAWENGSLKAYSSQGPTLDGRIKPDIAAPSGVTGTIYDELGHNFEGTSAAAPHVAGAAALVKSAFPESTNIEIRDYLLGNAIDLGASGVDNEYGYGKLTLPVPPSGNGEPPPTTSGIMATINGVDVDNNIDVSGVQGMQIHVNFDINNFRGQEGMVMANFFDQATGAPLADTNGSYRNPTNGQVATLVDFKPNSDTKHYSDKKLFMPYSEFDLPAGEHKLFFKVNVASKVDNQILKESESYPFVFRKEDDAYAFAEITNISVEQDIEENGERGMNIKTSFKVINHLNKPGQLAAYFYFDSASNRPLKDFNGQYRDADGNVAMGQGFTPGYNDAEFDLTLFFPYSELHVKSGKKHNLKFYLAIWDTENGITLEESDWQKFSVKL